MKITIVSGSTRRGRKTHRVALALQNKLTELQNEVVMIDLLEMDMGVFTERLSFMNPKPPELVEVAEALQSSNGLIFITPEYNGSISAALKNFIDIYGKDEFDGKPIAVATATAGSIGGIRAANQLQLIILSVMAHPLPLILLVPEISKQVDEEGNILNDAFEQKVNNFLNAFKSFMKKLGPKPLKAV